jgi:hypothetical protein
MLERDARPDRKTLSSPLSALDFAFRLAFFALAPFAIVVVAELFPVRGALIDVGLALLVFVASEAARTWSSRFRVLAWLLSEALAFEAHYRERLPRPFAYYVFYPLLAPYWLVVREARREFLMYRSYTLFGLLLLLGSLAWQYVSAWAPELGFRAYLPFVLLSLFVETMLVLSLLMPIATTVVWYHASFRRRRLVIVLLVGLASSALSLAYVARRREPVVSYATRERVRLRTEAAARRAHRVLGKAARAALAELGKGAPVEADGRVEGAPLERARAVLTTFYKLDEAQAFDIWASPRHAPTLVVVYFEGRPHKRPIWVAVRRDGSEMRRSSELPQGAFRAMRRASGESDAALWTWPDEIEVIDDEPSPRSPRKRVSAPGSASPAHSGSSGTAQDLQAPSAAPSSP